MRERDVVLCKPVCSATGADNGTLKGIRATELGTAAIRATVERARIEPGEVGSVIFGNVIQAGNRLNPARLPSTQRFRLRFQ